MKRALLGILTAGAWGLGCAHAEKPTDQLAATEAAVRTASDEGAKNIPPAALELQLAQEELEHSKDLMKDGKNEQAGFALQRSRADAEYAMALVRQQQADTEARAAKEQLRTLQNPSAP